MFIQSYLWQISGKFLVFIIQHARFAPAKIKAIIELPPSKHIWQLKVLQGRLAYISMFISNQSRSCQPFSRLIKKDTSIWVGSTVSRSSQKY